jgi:hypothetical protein
MTCYYFHVRDDDKLIIDKEGIDLPNPKAAFVEAGHAARDAIADKVKFGEDIGHREFEVRDILEQLANRARAYVDAVRLPVAPMPRTGNTFPPGAGVRMFSPYLRFR